MSRMKLNFAEGVCEALCGGPQKKRDGSKTRVGREEETDSEKEINELKVLYLFVLLDQFVV